MRRSLWSLVLVLAAWGNVRAEVICEQPVAQMGTIKAGAPLSHRFTFTNKGTAPVELTGARASCACFRPNLPKRSLAPGESATLDLVGNTLAQSAGPQTWRVRVEYREAGVDRELVLDVQAIVVVEVEVLPPVLTITTDREMSHELIVRDLRRDPLVLTGVETTSPALRARLGEVTVAPGGGWARRVVVEVGADYPVGRRDELLVLRSKDPDYPELRVPITVSKRQRAAIPVSPARILLTGTPGEPLPARLVQVGSEESLVEIERVEPQHPAITCTWAAGTVKVRVNGKQVPPEGLESAVQVILKSGVVTVPVRVEWARP
jgi:hypothetical protein